MCASNSMLVFIFLFVNVLGDINISDGDIQQQCIQNCPLQNRTDDGHYDIGCGYECNIEQCTQGCKLWNRALELHCQTVCNVTQEILSKKKLYCAMGCINAMTRYFTLLKEKIETPAAPALVADSLTNISLSLKWDFDVAQYVGVQYLVQCQYEKLSAAWESCRNQTWGPQDTVFVDHLQPYTKYRFRVALMVQHHDEYIVSEPSVVISTLPSGVPASPPVIVRAVPVDWSRISVSWEPGSFPNGPVLSYALRISENHLHGYSAMKDIPATENNFYLFQNLAAETNYTVKVSMRNGIGEGPPAIVFVSTPQARKVRDVQKPILILAAHHTIIQQSADIVEEPIILYKTNKFIEGLAIHVNRQLLFVSDSAGYIHQTLLIPNAPSSVILTPQNLKFKPLDLSMDWLNEQLYILGEVAHSSKNKVWQITRCDLDGSGLTVAVAGLRMKPRHIEVDPYNGFLFWVMDNISRSSLYRLDLADISNGIKHEIQPRLILEDPNIGAFTVDYTKFHLLVSNRQNNTVYSVSFDGKEIVDVRANTQQSMFRDVLSLAIANGLFYWTNGHEVVMEEYHKESDNYYHNAYPAPNSRSYMSIAVNLLSCQPVPVPINPPTGVQAILGPNLAKTSWQIPHLLGGLGKGAWQNWSYEINIKDLTHAKTISHRGINTTSYTIGNLEEDTEYIIKTAAYTSSGTGPWSSEFRGKTLTRPVDDKYPSIIWSASEGLLTSDVTGENVQTLIHKTNMKDYVITDITWYQDQLYLLSNTSHIYWYNMTSHERGQLTDIDSAASIAVDWIGKKLYWSNPKNHIIARGNLNGTQQEHLSPVATAKELNIDSVNAYMYWSTGHGVECARLNGVERQEYHRGQLFSGKQVMGLTLDMEEEYVYWIVRSYEGSTLFREKMAQHLPPGIAPSPDRVSNLQRPNIQGPLCYFSGHLLWLQDDKNAVIGDMKGQNAAVINGMSLSGLTMVSIIDPLLHIWPNNNNTKIVNVIPDSVFQESIQVKGKWNSFNITWLPTNSSDYGKVFYEVGINDGSNTTMITTDPSIKFWKPVPPYTRLDIAIRAYTYWGSAPQARVQLRSPSSIPSAPRNARCYVMFHHQPLSNNETQILFRWDLPEHENGIINGYVIKYWYKNKSKDTDVLNDVVVPSFYFQYFVKNLTKDETYYFQIQAYTSIGNGMNSNIVKCETTEETPPPLLIAIASDSIFVQDFDAHKNKSILETTIQPVDVAYLYSEEKLFWINEVQELFMSQMDGKNKIKLLSINGTGLSLTIDWVERCLYYVQFDQVHQNSSIFKVDLNKGHNGIFESEHVLSSRSMIITAEVSPFTRNLYWMINQNQRHVLMQASTDGQNIKNFFEHNRHSFKRVSNNEYLPCNCPDHDSIQKTFTIDHSDGHNSPQIIFIETKSHDIISADKLGCDCVSIVDKNTMIDSFSIRSLTLDKSKIFWSNATNGYTYMIDRTSNDIFMEKMNGNKLRIFGSYAQPYPPTKCLIPQLVPLQVEFESKKSNSITILMPSVRRNDGCDDISIASVQYVVYYMDYNEMKMTYCDDTCNKLTTFEKNVTVMGLRPFSKYIFSLAVRNYYSITQNIKDVIGPGVILQTDAGAPTIPQNVTATVLNPTMIEVKWLPPEQLNGETVWYEIHWETESTRTTSVVRQKEEHIAELNNLSSNQTYEIWVRAYAEHNETHSDSLRIKTRTYPEPHNITEVNSTAQSLEISWQISPYIESYVIQYSDVMSNQWKNITNNNNDDVVNIVVSKLKPKMKYKFRLALKYITYPELFIWPRDTRFTFETLGDRPSPPGVPIISNVKRDVCQISWEAARDNGAPIELYNLEGLRNRHYMTKRNTNRTAWFHNAPSVEEQDYEWETYYNGTDTKWILSGLSPDYRYSFRVAALNAYGWSDWSGESSEFDLNAAAMRAERHEQFAVILGISIPLLFTIFVCVILFFIYIIRRKNKEKKMAQAMLVNRPVSPDVELATLRELPRRDNFVHNTNALYISALPSAEELALLPQINRDQITLINFLGRGAFGEVYEGKAKRLGPNGADMKVAVKTLRKGATEQEKIEFLQEAQLMSHFKHEHILQLLGVCLDTHFIIMELMEGGDLLTYLRSNRKPQTSSDALTILDLLSMCVDVARGCRYLEEMHFVHRDLACRNCLVSSIDRQTRVVKIGDFGLARDIYKNDYYRKEGEGLLPVRWMAPESLVDGVFTCQSDVWSFGVLMWEIMTLGQQPYPARNNLEVLHYVKGGGRLEKPCHCPEQLHQLMMTCWSYQPEHRPTFKYCLDVLEELHNSTTDGPLTAVHSGNYISTITDVPNGVSNYAYFQDENHNSSGSSWKTESGEETSRDQVPLVPTLNYKHVSNGQLPNHQLPTEIPKYLEIICDNTEPAFNDGYEVPRSSTRSNKSVTSENRSRTFSNSSVMSNGSVSSVKNPNGLQKGINHTFKTGEKCAYSNLTTQPLLESLGSEESGSDCPVSTTHNLTQIVC